MARVARPWFRFYVEALADRKLRRLTPTHRWLWVALLGAARMSSVPGALVVAGEALTDDELADIAGVPVREVRKAMPLYEKAEMLERVDGVWHVTNWAARQFESDDVTERTRRHRSKERSNVVRGNPPETETETEQPPQPHAERGEHLGQHPNCRACGTNPRAQGTNQRPPAPTAPHLRPISDVLADAPPPDPELNLAGVAHLRQQLHPDPGSAA